jgi:hypothetical protein
MNNPIAKDSIFEPLSHSHAVFISPRGVARIMAAVQGIHAISAIFNQREIDHDGLDNPEEEGTNFGPHLGIGLLSALGCCAQVIETYTTDKTTFSAPIEADEPEAAQLERVAFELSAASKRPKA